MATQDFEIRGLGVHTIGKAWGYLEDQVINTTRDFKFNVIALSQAGSEIES